MLIRSENVAGGCDSLFTGKNKNTVRKQNVSTARRSSVQQLEKATGHLCSKFSCPHFSLEGKILVDGEKINNYYI
jgi:hypothetical protein